MLFLDDNIILSAEHQNFFSSKFFNEKFIHRSEDKLSSLMILMRRHKSKDLVIETITNLIERKTGIKKMSIVFQKLTEVYKRARQEKSNHPVLGADTDSPSSSRLQKSATLGNTPTRGKTEIRRVTSIVPMVKPSIYKDQLNYKQRATIYSSNSSVNNNHHQQKPQMLLYPNSNYDDVFFVFSFFFWFWGFFVIFYSN